MATRIGSTDALMLAPSAPDSHPSAPSSTSFSAWMSPHVSSNAAESTSSDQSRPLRAPGLPAPPPRRRPQRRMSLRSCDFAREKLLSWLGLKRFLRAQVVAAASPFFRHVASHVISACAAARGSDQLQNSLCLATSFSLLPEEEKGERPAETIRTAAARSGTPRIAPSIAARPSNGSRGRRARTSPTGSSLGGSPGSMASMAASSSIAASTAATLGGSGASARKLRGSRPRATACKQL
mmetsp:Transcript_105173/g.297227  ORF Transcript_105173/g.297227 Transcript_105173/m.297227 type:complete len:238 (-) Transcript_105173:2636-3349(-)